MVVVVGGSVVVVNVVVAMVDVVEVVIAIVVDVEGSTVSMMGSVDEVGAVVIAGVASDVDEHAAVTHASAPTDSSTRMWYRSQPRRHREGVM